jgi:hypothetical protein
VVSPAYPAFLMADKLQRIRRATGVGHRSGLLVDKTIYIERSYRMLCAAVNRDFSQFVPSSVIDIADSPLGLEVDQLGQAEAVVADRSNGLVVILRQVSITVIVVVSRLFS